MRAYLRTSTVAARAQLVRRREQVTPLMQQYFSGRGLVPLEVQRFEQLEPYPIDGRPFCYAVAITDAGREILLLERTDAGFLVDWETHVGFNPMTPEAFVSDRPGGAFDFRVYASPDDYYSGGFDDREKFLPAQLEFPHSAVDLVGYFDKQSAGFSRFLQLVDRHKQVPLILSLEWPGGDGSGNPPQVRIKRVVAERWLLLD